MNKSIQLLLDFSQELGIEITNRMVHQFHQYAEQLVLWNQKMNLTAITDPEQIFVKHFIDSLSIVQATSFKEPCSLIDIGTGAGFPGVPLKIVFSNIKLTLLDSLNKRLLFLQDLLSSLDLSADFLHLRAEEGGRKPDLREKFPIVTSRAVASLRVLSEYCLPYVNLGGKFVALKGPSVTEELSEAKQAISILGGELEKVFKFSLPDESQRSIVVIHKMKETPKIYPRSQTHIKKKPL